MADIWSTDELVQGDCVVWKERGAAKCWKTAIRGMDVQKESQSYDENHENVVLAKPRIYNSRGRSTAQMEQRGPELGT